VLILSPAARALADAPLIGHWGGIETLPGGLRLAVNLEITQLVPGQDAGTVHYQGFCRGGAEPNCTLPTPVDCTASLTLSSERPPTYTFGESLEVDTYADCYPLYKTRTETQTGPDTLSTKLTDLSGGVETGTLTRGTHAVLPLGLTPAEKQALHTSSMTLKFTAGGAAAIGFWFDAIDFAVCPYCGLAFAAVSFALSAGDFASSYLADDPPRGDYRVFATPARFVVPRISPGPRLSSRAAHTMHALEVNDARIRALGTPLVLTIERYEGALAAGPSASAYAARQLKLALSFGREFGRRLHADPGLRRLLARVMHKTVNIRLSPRQVRKLKRSLSKPVSPRITRLLKRLGLSRRAQARFITHVRAHLPHAVNVRRVLTNTRADRAELVAASAVDTIVSELSAWR
jgi:hypothetical protein